MGNRTDGRVGNRTGDRTGNLHRSTGRRAGCNRLYPKYSASSCLTQLLFDRRVAVAGPDRSSNLGRRSCALLGIKLERPRLCLVQGDGAIAQLAPASGGTSQRLAGRRQGGVRI